MFESGYVHTGSFTVKSASVLMTVTLWRKESSSEAEFTEASWRHEDWRKFPYAGTHTALVWTLLTLHNGGGGSLCSCQCKTQCYRIQVWKLRIDAICGWRHSPSLVSALSQYNYICELWTVSCEPAELSISSYPANLYSIDPGPNQPLKSWNCWSLHVAP